MLKESREGIPLNKEEFCRNEKIISNAVKGGQHIYHAIVSNDLPVSKSSVYNRLYHYCDYRGGVKHENEKICSFDAHPLHDALPEHFGVCGQ